MLKVRRRDGEVIMYFMMCLSRDESVAVEKLLMDLVGEMWLNLGFLDVDAGSFAPMLCASG